MSRRLLGVIAAAVIGASTVTATAASAAPPVPAPPKAAIDFTSIVALNNCSGSLVRTPTAADTDPAMVLTNGHCYEGGEPGAGVVITNRSSSRTFSLLDSTGQRTLATLRATSVLYATMTDTDAALYKLNTTYAAIKSSYNTPALVMQTDHPTTGADLRVVSGYWKRIYSCKLDGFAYRVREADWTWKDSLRYTSSCNVIGGTSGSPVIDAGTGKVVGANNTINESGGRCTLNNPCEVDEAGKVTVRANIGYAQQTYNLATCIAPGTVLDLNRAGCEVPRGTRHAGR
ncbi:S1 family peptidase [Actinomadura macra]|uniref:S1 family peptidase n=1 Tax=Actinomadura macra TaxID=46164 RepID=UPI00082D5A1F|nr:serine protease [Actinomadura macra]